MTIFHCSGDARLDGKEHGIFEFYVEADNQAQAQEIAEKKIRATIAELLSVTTTATPIEVVGKGANQS